MSTQFRRPASADAHRKSTAAQHAAACGRPSPPAPLSGAARRVTPGGGFKSRPLFAFLSAVLLGAVSLPARHATAQLPTAQEAQQREADEVVRISTNLVQVDAVITDGGGRPVTDLRPEEVRLYEDDKPRTISHFSYVAAGNSGSPRRPAPTPGGRDTPPTDLRTEDVRRTIALVVDDLGLSSQSIPFVRRALKRFVDEQMRPGDLVAVIRTSGGVGALQQFTSDKRQLYAAVEAVKWYAGGRSGLIPLATAERPLPGRLGAYAEAKSAELNRFREDLFAAGTLSAIGYVVGGLRELPGRKAVLVISDGFRLYDGDDPKPANRVLQKLQQLVDQAARASVVIHTMNAAGLITRSATAADSLADNTVSGARDPEGMGRLMSDRVAVIRDTQTGLDLLAEKTGGVAVRGANDLGGGIRRVLDDEQGYYLIGYRPDESTFATARGRGLFHKLELKVKRPGQFKVRMRGGFLGVPDAGAVTASPRSPQEQITRALLSPFGASGVRVRLTSVFADDSKSGSFTRSILYVDAKDLAFTEGADGWRTATFDVVAVTFDEAGNVVDQLSRTDSLRSRGEAHGQVLKDGFAYFFVFPVKRPGAYQLRAVLRDHGSGRVGSAGQFVEIPDLKKGRLALSGLVVDAAAGQQGGDRGQPVPEASEAVRHFKPGMMMRYSFVIYNARLDGATRSPRLQVQARLFRGGQPVFTGKVQPFALNNPADLTRLTAEGAITLGADMTPGEYVLQVVVTDLLADEQSRTATQWMDFEVVK